MLSSYYLKPAVTQETGFIFTLALVVHNFLNPVILNGTIARASERQNIFSLIGIFKERLLSDSVM